MIANLKKIVKLALGRAVIVDIIPPLEFVGWKMATGTRAPWHEGGSNKLAQAFAQCDQELAEHITLR